MTTSRRRKDSKTFVPPPSANLQLLHQVLVSIFIACQPNALQPPSQNSSTFAFSRSLSSLVQSLASYLSWIQHIYLLPLRFD